MQTFGMYNPEPNSNNLKAKNISRLVSNKMISILRIEINLQNILRLGVSKLQLYLIF